MSQRNVATRHRRAWTIRVATLWSVATIRSLHVWFVAAPGGFLFAGVSRWKRVIDSGWGCSIDSGSNSSIGCEAWRSMYVSMLQQNVAMKHRREWTTKYVARIRWLHFLIFGGLRRLLFYWWFATRRNDRIRVTLQYQIKFELIDNVWSMKKHFWFVLWWKFSWSHSLHELFFIFLIGPRWPVLGCLDWTHF